MLCVFHHNAQPFATDGCLGIELVEQLYMHIRLRSSDSLRLTQHTFNLGLQAAHFRMFQNMRQTLVGQPNNPPETVSDLAHYSLNLEVT
jgi:hypothetical protein